MDWDGKVVPFSLTDVGIKRTHNQDSLGISVARNRELWESRGHLFLVADGMGAHAVGELASKMAVDHIIHNFSKIRALSSADALKQAVLEANQAINERGEQNPEFHGMGTTATSLLMLPEGAYVAHVGDSRCYRIRANRIEQLSYDHSLQWEIARRENLTPEQLKSVPSNIITRSLGPEPIVSVDLAGPYDVQIGDRFLLCSDGLSGPVSDREIWSVVSHLPGDEACRFLVNLANLRGGIDNITVVLVQVGDPAAAPSIRGSSGPTLAIRLWRLAKHVGNRIVHWWRYRHEPPPPPPPPPPIHRTCECSLGRSTVEKLARAERHLRELGIEESWKVDWPRLMETHGNAEEAAAADNLPLALREYCRAISILSAGQNERRDKQEVLMPNWEEQEDDAEE